MTTPTPTDPEDGRLYYDTPLGDGTYSRTYIDVQPFDGDTEEPEE